MAKQHVKIEDLNENAMGELTEADLQKVTGGIAIIASNYKLGFKIATPVQLDIDAWPTKWKVSEYDGKSNY